MKIGIVLVNYNQNQYTLGCLESLSKIDRGENAVEFFVVDNNSKSPPKLEDEYGSIKTILLKNNKNLGYSGGVNTGISKALTSKCDYILILNNDTIHDKSFLLNLVGAMKNTSVGIASPKIYFAKGKEFHKNRYENENLGKVIWYAGGVIDMKNVLASHRGVDEVDRGQFDTLSETDFATGCAMLVGKEVFEKIGLFDEKYFLYLEDLDFSQRAKKAGFRILFQPSSVIWHYNAVSTGGSGSFLQDYFITRNRMLFGMKYAGFRAKLALIRESIKLIMSGRKWQRIGIKDYYLGNLGRGSLPA